MVQWQLPTYNSSEDSQVITICADLNQPAEKDVSVMIITISGTASGISSLLIALKIILPLFFTLPPENLDFTELSTINIFTAGTAESCVNITIIGDSLLEETETFNVLLESSGDPSVSIGSIFSSTVMILDDDSK